MLNPTRNETHRAIEGTFGEDRGTARSRILGHQLGVGARREQRQQQRDEQRRPQHAADLLGQHPHQRIDTRAEDVAENEQIQQRPGDPALELAVRHALGRALLGLRRHSLLRCSLIRALYPPERGLHADAAFGTSESAPGRHSALRGGFVRRLMGMSLNIVRSYQQYRRCEEVRRDHPDGAGGRTVSNAMPPHAGRRNVGRHARHSNVEPTNGSACVGATGRRARSKAARDPRSRRRRGGTRGG